MRWLIEDRFENEKWDLILIRKSLIDLEMKTDPGFFHNRFRSQSWSRLQCENRDPI